MGLISNGTTIFDAGALDSGLAKGAITFMKKLTASSSATLAFVHGSGGVDFSTYKEYMFTFNNIHPATDGEDFQFNMSIDSGSNYNVAKTTSWFYAYHSYAIDALAAVEYNGSFDLAEGTGDQILTNNIGADADQSASGSLTLFNPSSTTFVKHFTANVNTYHGANQTVNSYVAGYANTTSDIDAIIFRMNSGNIDAGDICLYGIA